MDPGLLVVGDEVDGGGVVVEPVEVGEVEGAEGVEIVGVETTGVDTVGGRFVTGGVTVAVGVLTGFGLLTGLGVGFSGGRPAALRAELADASWQV